MDITDDWERNLDMTTAVTGLLLSKQDALRSLTDNKGNAIEFEEQEDGSLISKPVEGDNYTYTYSLVPQTTLVTVSVAKIPKENKSKARAATSQEEKEAEKYNADKEKGGTIKDNDKVTIKKSY